MSQQDTYSRSWIRRSRFAGPVVACVFVAVFLAPAHGQCQPRWTTFVEGMWSLALTVFDEDGDGPAPPMLFAGGYLRHAGVPRPPGDVGISVRNIARFDGWDWYPVGEGLGSEIGDGVASLYGSQVPGREDLSGVFAGGGAFPVTNPALRGIARWQRREWVPVGGGFDWGWPLAIVEHHHPHGAPQSALIVGGGFQFEPGLPNATSGLARWDGKNWTDVGGGLREFHPTLTPWVYAMAYFDEDGPGGKPPALFVGGSFVFAGGLSVGRLARWDGQTWSSVGGRGVNASPVTAMCVFDDGNGSQLYVGGSFSAVGGPPGEWIPAYRLARWDGKNWSAVPGWGIVGGQVNAMAVFDDDGAGPNKPALFVGGSFWNNPNIPGSWNLVKWDGDRWEALPPVTGLAGGYVSSLQVFDDDHDGPNPGGLYVAGNILYVGNERADGLARWGCPLTPPCLADCDFSTGFGVLDVFDFLCFANRFHAGAPYACDCDTSTGHGVCDIFDFLCFGQRFQRGCD